MKKILLLLFILVLSNISFCGEECPPEKLYGLARQIPNFHMVTPAIMRGSQPSEEGFTELKNDYNVKTILNLRNAVGHNEWEEGFVKGLGIDYINIPMSGVEEQSVETIERCLSIITNPDNHPVFVHCHAGKDRTGLVMAAYRIKYQGWGLKEAIMEMLAYGYDRGCCFNLEKSLIRWAEQRRLGGDWTFW